MKVREKDPVKAILFIDQIFDAIIYLKEVSLKRKWCNVVV